MKPLTENPETKVEVLVQALFFARWCNRDHTLVELNQNLLSDPKSLKKALAQVPMPPWCNETAYPVETVTWKGTEYSRLDAATELFHKVKFIYSEKATKFCEISTLLFSYVVPVKSKVEIFAKCCGLLRIYEL